MSANTPYLLGESLRARAAMRRAVFYFGFVGAVWIGLGVRDIAKGDRVPGVTGVLVGITMLVVFVMWLREMRKQRAVGDGGGSADGPRV
jgi:hypothetical protein